MVPSSLPCIYICGDQLLSYKLKNPKLMERNDFYSSCALQFIIIFFLQSSYSWSNWKVSPSYELLIILGLGLQPRPKCHLPQTPLAPFMFPPGSNRASTTKHNTSLTSYTVTLNRPKPAKPLAVILHTGYDWPFCNNMLLISEMLIQEASIATFCVTHYP